MHISRVLESRVRKMVGCMINRQLFVGLYRSSANHALKTGEDSANHIPSGCGSIRYWAELARYRWFIYCDIDASMANTFVTSS